MSAPNATRAAINALSRRLFSYAEPCPVCGKDTKYEVYDVYKAPDDWSTEMEAAPREHIRRLEIECTACSWREVRC